MSGGEFGDRFVELVLVLGVGHAGRHPPDGAGGAVATRIGSDSQRFAVPGMEIDLDRPAEFGDREVEPNVPVAGEIDSMLTHQTSNSGPTEGVGDPHLRMGLGRASRQTSIERLEERPNPRSSG